MELNHLRVTRTASRFAAEIVVAAAVLNIVKKRKTSRSSHEMFRVPSGSQIVQQFSVSEKNSPSYICMYEVDLLLDHGSCSSELFRYISMTYRLTDTQPSAHSAGGIGVGCVQTSV